MKGKSIYKSTEGKQEILALYQEKLDGLNLSYSYQKVDTFAGSTNVVVVGEKHLPPIVLLHGVNAGAPIALEAIAGMAKDYRIYAIDIIGQPNLSAETRVPMNDLSYGRWLEEVADALHLDCVPYIAVSYGAVILQRLMIHAPQRIERVILCVPGGIANGSAWASFKEVLYPMFRYTFRKSRANLIKFMDSFYTDYDESTISYMRAIMNHVHLDTRMPPLAKAKDFKTFKQGVFMMVAENDIFFPKEKLIPKAKEIFPGFQEAIVLKGSKHAPGLSHFPEVEDLIRRFLKARNPVEVISS